MLCSVFMTGVVKRTRLVNIWPDSHHFEDNMILIKPQNKKEHHWKYKWITKKVYNDHVKIKTNGDLKVFVNEGWFLLRSP